MFFKFALPDITHKIVSIEHTQTWKTTRSLNRQNWKLYNSLM